MTSQICHIWPKNSVVADGLSRGFTVYDGFKHVHVVVLNERGFLHICNFWKLGPPCYSTNVMKITCEVPFHWWKTLGSNLGTCSSQKCMRTSKSFHAHIKLASMLKIIITTSKFGPYKSKHNTLKPINLRIEYCCSKELILL